MRAGDVLFRVVWRERVFDCPTIRECRYLHSAGSSWKVTERGHTRLVDRIEAQQWHPQKHTALSYALGYLRAQKQLKHQAKDVHGAERVGRLIERLAHWRRELTGKKEDNHE